MSDEPGGRLEQCAGEHWYRARRRPPAPDLADLIEYFWTVHWDLRALGPYPLEILTEPCVDVAIEHDRAEVHGVVTRRFTRILEGCGWVFGMKFQPAGFHPLLGSRVAALTNRVVPISLVLGPPGDGLVERIRSLDDTARMVEVAEEFVRGRLPQPDPMVPAINRIARMMEERDIIRVADVVSRSGIGERRLQRLFAEYVGATPKWVIRRYRLHEAAERLATEPVDLAELALELGYFDQAHFARDFRAMVGRPPASYARNATRP